MFKWLSSFFGKHQITELEKVPKGTSSSTGKRRLPKGPDSCYLVGDQQQMVVLKK